MEGIVLEIKVKEEANWQRLVEVSMSHAELESEIEAAFHTYQKKMKLQGFRPGKVPMQIVKNLYGASIETEAVTDMIPKVLQKVQQEKGLKVVSPEKIEHFDYKPGGDLALKYKVEVEPEFELGKYDKFKIERQVYEVTEPDIEHALEDLREEHARFELSEEAVTENDYLRVDIQEVDATGLPLIGQHYESQLVEFGGQNPQMAELAQQLLGARVNETRRVWLMPERPAVTEAPEEPLAYAVTIKEVRRKTLPPIDDELAKSAGKFENLEALRRALHTRIGKNVQAQLDEQFHHNLIDEIIKNNPIEIPEGMIRQYLDSFIQQMKESAKNQEIDESAVREKYRPNVIWNIKWQLIRKKLVEISKADVTDDDIRHSAEAYAAERGLDGTRIWHQVKNDKTSMRRMRADLLEKKVIDFLVAQQTVKEEKVTRKDFGKSKLVEA